jgi:hypothetical protein
LGTTSPVKAVYSCNTSVWRFEHQRAPDDDERWTDVESIGIEPDARFWHVVCFRVVEHGVKSPFDRPHIWIRIGFEPVLYVVKGMSTRSLENQHLSS